MISAQHLAGRYEAYVPALHAALRRGQREAAPLRHFMVWIEGCWRDEAPPEPAAPPAAVSAGGWGTVRWHEAGGTLRGYVPGLAGCYEVAADVAPPALVRPACRTT